MSDVSQLSEPSSPGRGMMLKRHSILPVLVSYATTSPGMFIGHCSLIEAPGRFGVEPVCIEIDETSTLPTIAGGELFATRPSRAKPGRSFHRKFAAISTTPFLPKVVDPPAGLGIQRDQHVIPHDDEYALISRAIRPVADATARRSCQRVNDVVPFQKVARGTPVPQQLSGRRIQSDHVARSRWQWCTSRHPRSAD